MAGDISMTRPETSGISSLSVRGQHSAIGQNGGQLYGLHIVATQVRTSGAVLTGGLLARVFGPVSIMMRPAS